jgi:hypothetical protein
VRKRDIKRDVAEKRDTMMELTESSKEIINKEYEKIELIAKYIRDGGHRYEDPVEIALAIYSKRYEDLSVIDDEEDD